MSRGRRRGHLDPHRRPRPPHAPRPRAAAHRARGRARARRRSRPSSRRSRSSRSAAGSARARRAPCCSTSIGAASRSRCSTRASRPWARRWRHRRRCRPRATIEPRATLRGGAAVAPAARCRSASASGVSPFFAGFYDSRIWVPIGLGAGRARRPAASSRAPLRLEPRRRAGARRASAASARGRWCSTLWAESVEQAVVDGNRLLVARRAARGRAAARPHATAARSGCSARSPRRRSRWPASTLVRHARRRRGRRCSSPAGSTRRSATSTARPASSCWRCGRASRSPSSAAGRRSRASAWRPRRCSRRLLVLSQSRGVALAAIVSALVVLALVPGRLRRAWALVGARRRRWRSPMPRLLDVYEQGRAAAVPADVASPRPRWRRCSRRRSPGVAVGLRHVAAAALDAPSPRRARRRRRVVLAVGVAALAAVAVASPGDIARHASTGSTRRSSASASSRRVRRAQRAPSSRLASGAGTRYDYWRDRLERVPRRPAGGRRRRQLRRRLLRAARHDRGRPPAALASSCRSLTELGLVGAALLLAFLAGAGAGARSARRRGATLGVGRGPRGRGRRRRHRLARAHERRLDPPAAGRDGRRARAAAPCCCMRRPDAAPERRPVIACRRGRSRGSAPRWRPRSSSRSALATGRRQPQPPGARGALPRRARRTRWRSDPADALRDADRSLRLDPEAVETYYVKAAALARFNEAAAARRDAARGGRSASRTTSSPGRCSATSPSGPATWPRPSATTRAHRSSTHVMPASAGGSRPGSGRRERLASYAVRVRVVERHSSRVCLALGATNAAAQGDGVTVDPDSPTAKQYKLPIESARRAGEPEGRRQARSAWRPTRRRCAAPLFGEGIVPVALARGRARQATSRRPTGSKPSTTAVAKPRGRAAAPLKAAIQNPGAPSGGIGAALLIAGGAALVLLIGHARRARCCGGAARTSARGTSVRSHPGPARTPRGRRRASRRSLAAAATSRRARAERSRRASAVAGVAAPMNGA